MELWERAKEGNFQYIYFKKSHFYANGFNITRNMTTKQHQQWQHKQVLLPFKSLGLHCLSKGQMDNHGEDQLTAKMDYTSVSQKQNIESI